jgi:uncharacterized protein (TIGR03083 family)
MTNLMLPLGFDDMLDLVASRSDALRAAAAGNLDARVPGCPDWSVRDLVAHLGEVQLFWSAAVAAGPADQPPGDDVIGDRDPHGDLLTWSADATTALLDALEEAGPDRGCWAWWSASGAPMTAGAVARHQVQEAGVHAFDAQQAAGRAEPLPPPVAADGVGEFLTVGLRCMGAWPHDRAAVVLEAGDGGTWHLDLGSEGAHPTLLDEGQAGAMRRDATVTADPGDLVLAFYRRVGLDPAQVSGDAVVVARLLDWPDMD